MLPILQRNKNDLLFQLYGYQTNDSKVVKITILCTLWFLYYMHTRKLKIINEF